MTIKSWISPRQSNWHHADYAEFKRDLRKGSQAQIYDPLWFLARQWQMGEFTGEDAGSPVLAEVEGDFFPIDCVHQGNQSLVYNPQEIPLEALIERESLEQVEPDVRTRAQAGLLWFKQLEQAGLAFNRSSLISRPLAK